MKITKHVGHPTQVFKKRFEIVMIDNKFYIEIKPFVELLTIEQLRIIQLKFFRSEVLTNTEVAKMLEVSPSYISNKITTLTDRLREYYAQLKTDYNLTKKEILPLLGNSNILYNHIF